MLIQEILAGATALDDRLMGVNHFFPHIFLKVGLESTTITRFTQGHSQIIPDGMCSIEKAILKSL